MSPQANSNDLKHEGMAIEQAKGVKDLSGGVASIGLSEDLSGNDTKILNEEDDIFSRADFDRIACTLYVDDYEFDTTNTLYDGVSTVDDDTLYDGASVRVNNDDDTSTLVGGSEKDKVDIDSFTPKDLLKLRVIAVGVNVKKHNKKEYLFITLSVRQLLRENYQDILNDRDKELWQIEKSYNDFAELDNTLRELDYVRHEQSRFDKSMFVSHSPEKTLKRRAKIDQYFRLLFATIQYKDPLPVWQFLNSGMVRYRKAFGYTMKEGYLARKEGMFNTSWKLRYCVLRNTVFEIYETNASSSPIQTIPLHEQTMTAHLKCDQPFNPLKNGFSIMHLKKDKPGFHVESRYMFWPTTYREEKERDEWCAKLQQVLRQNDPLSKAKALEPEIQEAKQGGSLLKKLSEKK